MYFYDSCSRRVSMAEISDQIARDQEFEEYLKFLSELPEDEKRLWREEFAARDSFDNAYATATANDFPVAKRPKSHYLDYVDDFAEEALWDDDYID